MKKFVCLLMVCLTLFTISTAAFAETTITLGNDVIANTTPFGNAVSFNKQYKLFKGMVVEVLGEHDGWTVIRYNDEYGTLYLETGTHNYSFTPQVPTGPSSVVSNPAKKGVVGEGWQVWARYEPKSVFEEGEAKGDVILHSGDIVEINGDIVTDEQGNEYYPIRMLKDGYYVQRYVTAKYIDIPIE